MSDRREISGNGRTGCRTRVRVSSLFITSWSLYVCHVLTVSVIISGKCGRMSQFLFVATDIVCASFFVLICRVMSAVVGLGDDSGTSESRLRLG